MIPTIIFYTLVDCVVAPFGLMRSIETTHDAWYERGLDLGMIFGMVLALAWLALGVVCGYLSTTGTLSYGS